jgi:hypothetical protein
MKNKTLKVGDIQKWQGFRNSDTGEIDGGYLFFVTAIYKDSEGNDCIESSGKKISGVKNRSEAIRKYKQKSEGQ